MLREAVFAAGVAVVMSPLCDARAEDAGASRDMSSPVAFATGLALTGAGSSGVIPGAILLATGGGECDEISLESLPTDAELNRCIDGLEQQAGGAILVMTGGLLLFAGVAVMVAGASPASSEATTALVRVSPGGASLTVSF